VIAVNGGAVIPALLSLYLLFKNRMWWNGAIATAVITVIIHMLAYPVSGWASRCRCWFPQSRPRWSRC